jgi:hypothetical protein
MATHASNNNDTGLSGLNTCVQVTMFPVREPLLHRVISGVEAGILIIMGVHLIGGVIVSA